MSKNHTTYQLENFFYRLTGNPDGPKLIFLHGVMGYAANWRTVAKAFEDNFHVLIYDQRGHGRSVQPASGYSPSDYARDLFCILEELNWIATSGPTIQAKHALHLVGHSLGGRIALQFAHDYPNTLSRLVIEDIGPDRKPSSLYFVEKILNTIPVPFASLVHAREYFTNEFLQIFHDHPFKKSLAAFLMSNIATDDQGRGVWRFYEPGIRESLMLSREGDLWEMIQSLKIPTLWMRGAQSSDLTQDVFQRIGQANSLIKTVEIPQAGHWIHADQPKLFIYELKKFFDEAPPQSK